MKLVLFAIALTLLLGFFEFSSATTYYVASSIGRDDSDGLSQSHPFATITKVNELLLQPGDEVLFKCGDIWRGEMLVITASGEEGNPITFSSYPADCSDKPVFSGAQPISGWVSHAQNIYYADLSAGANSGKFPLGINQLFKDNNRLPFGRWPNPTEDDGGVEFHNGYSVIDSQPSSAVIVDSELPEGNWGSWAGGTAHIKGMRWYILNRDISGVSGSNLTLESNTGCWGGSCSGWGYFINNHLNTLDRDGEWFYDSASSRVYLYLSAGSPEEGAYEGSVILTDDERYWGLVVLGEDLADHIKYVVIDNFTITRGYRNGITTPTNLKTHENSHLELRNNVIRDMDATGIKLATWVWSAEDGGVNGWRGGNNLTVAGNLIDGANHYGIDTYSKYSMFQDNVIKNIGIIDNLGKSGLGCANGDGGRCTEPGDGFRIKVDKVDDSGHHNTLEANRLENIAYNGVDVFGHNNTLSNNYIYNSCATKGDCGGVRTFGRDSLSTTPVYDLVLENNIIQDIPGNIDGAHETYRSLFGFGLYIDNYSRNVQVNNNSVINASVHGILYQRSTGTMSGNILYNNVSATSWGAQVNIGAAASVTSMHYNILFGLQTKARTLSTSPSTLSGSDNNYFFNPVLDANINISGTGTRTLAEWQSGSGMDLSSKKNWFTYNEGEPVLSEVFINDTMAEKSISLGNKQYFDLDQNTIKGILTLQPMESAVLIFDSLVAPPLSHSIALLQLLAGMEPQEPLSLLGDDIDGDNKLDLADAIGILRSFKDSE